MEQTMKGREVRPMSDEELATEEQRLRRRHFDLRAQAVTEKLENPNILMNIRRDIARILTEKRRRQIQERS